MLPIDFFLHASQQYPHHQAAVDLQSGLSVTYSALKREILSLAAQFQFLSGESRPAVTILADNSLEMLVTILATYACHGVLIPLTPTSVARDISRKIEISRPHIVVFDSKYEELIDGFKGHRIKTGDLGLLKASSLHSQFENKQPLRPATNISEQAAIKFTGGSTGTPKAVVQSFRCLNTMIASIMVMFEFSSEERFLIAPPMTHGAGTFVLPVLSRGGCLFISSKPSVNELQEILHRHQITSTWMPPTMLQKLVLKQEENELPMPGLRELIYGGAACPSSLLERARKLFGPVIGVTYGLTEAPVVIAGMSGKQGGLEQKPGSAGRIGSLCRVAVLNENNQPDESAGVVGEILASGDLLMSGYLNMPQETESVMHEGWLRTGDIGYLDEQGYLFIVGRSKDIIISGGFNVHPAEVEEIYMEHPEISECIVFGAPDALWGERVEIAVVLQQEANANEQSLIAFGKQNLGSIRAPKVVHQFDFFPKNALGKTERKVIIHSLLSQNSEKETQQ